mmetsp:Transcript_9431/g.14389  ORF Transcript_9431/g.14389 Transcript_9431/m.14389 type:complete len:101 (-) Transcript_9431:57-359(-)
MVYAVSTIMYMKIDINACKLHVVPFPDAIKARLSLGTIHVERKFSQNPRKRLATVMRVIIFVVNGIVLCSLIFKDTSRSISMHPIIDKVPPTLGMMANAL